jgi:hypothetical protein
MNTTKSPAFLREQNAITLEFFADWMRDWELPEKVIEQHLANIEFYVNGYLLEEGAVTAEEGIREIGGFLGYWFVQNAASVDDEALLRSAASLKKFYRFMYELGRVEKTDLVEMKKLIKRELPEWMEALREYRKASGGEKTRAEGGAERSKADRGGSEHGGR